MGRPDSMMDAFLIELQFTFSIQHSAFVTVERPYLMRSRGVLSSFKFLQRPRGRYAINVIKVLPHRRSNIPFLKRMPFNNH